jgi:hypothetical protein
MFGGIQKYELAVDLTVALNSEKKVNYIDNVCLEKRVCEAKRKLLNILYEYHSKYLQERKLQIQSLDKMTQWHPGFKIEDVPEITELPIPDPPSLSKQTILSTTFDQVILLLK